MRTDALPGQKVLFDISQEIEIIGPGTTNYCYLCRNKSGATEEYNESRMQMLDGTPLPKKGFYKNSDTPVELYNAIQQAVAKMRSDK